MKKIVKFIFLIVVCLLPVIVDAKVNLNLEWTLRNYRFITSYEGNYYFVDSDNYYDVFDVYSYNKNKELIETTTFDYDFNYKMSDLYNDYLNKKLYGGEDSPLCYNEELNLYYEADFWGSLYARVYGEYSNDPLTWLHYDAENDRDALISLLGKKYELYEKCISLGISYLDIFEEGEYFNVSGEFNNSMRYLIFNDDFDIIYETTGKYDDFIRLHVDGDKIYKISNGRKLEIFKIGEEECEFLYEFDLLESLENQVVDYYFYLIKFEIKDNILFLLYDRTMPKTSDSEYASTEKVRGNDYLFVKYRISGDVEFISSNNEEFVSEKKTDENDKEYVEFKITPKEGYIVDKIIVTDSDGKQIDVTDNKFYMPMNDVKIEVKYVQGEYLPIPDTGLGKSITLILIGTILIGLGLYTFNFVRQE